MSVLTIFQDLPALGEGEWEIEVEYTYDGDPREVQVTSAAALVDRGHMQVWHLLTQQQRAQIEEQCVVDHRDRMESAACAAREDDRG